MLRGLSTDVRPGRRVGAALMTCLVLGAAACGAPTGSASSPAPPGPPTSSGVPVGSVDKLAGEWEVVALDGTPPTRGPADSSWPVVISLDYDEDRTEPDGSPTSPLWFSGRFDCNTSSGPVVVDEGTFAAVTRVTTQVGCARDGYGGTDIAVRLGTADSARYADGDETRLELLDEDRVVLALRLVRRQPGG